MSLLVVGGLVDGVPSDVRIEGGRIVEVAAGLRRSAGEELLDAAGGEVLPGLHDHHVHLRATAAAARSVRVGPPNVVGRAEMAAVLREAAAELGPGEWVRAVGYHDTVAGPLDRFVLDAMVGERPVRVQHRSGALWVLNSAGMAALGVDGDWPEGAERDPDGAPNGRLFRLDAWLRERWPASPDAGATLRAVSEAALARGVTGLTEATPDLARAEVNALSAAVAAGDVAQRLTVMAPADVDVPVGARVGRGPVKVLLDDLTLPVPDELAAQLAPARRAGLPVAVHCVTAVQLVVVLAALARVGTVPGDRLEHAAVVPTDLMAEVVRLSLTVVTNPAFVETRGDEYLTEVDPVDLPALYRAGSLLGAGVALGAGTDAPFGPSDPWVAVRAAVRRTTGLGRLLGPREGVPLRRAVALFGGRADAPAVARTVTPGQPADLCVLAGPLDDDAVLGPGGPGVTATVVAGQVCFTSEEERPVGAGGKAHR